MPQAFYDESANNAPQPDGKIAAPDRRIATPDGGVASPEGEPAESDLYSFEGFTVESNTKVSLIPKIHHRKHG